MAALPYTGLNSSAGYSDAFTAGPSRPIRFMAYMNAAASAVICMLFLAGFAIRINRGALKWIQPDGVMTRPDFQVIIPAIWCLLAAGFVPLHCLVANRKNAQSTWAIFNVAYYYSQTSVCLAAIIVCLAWVSRVPFVRSSVEKYTGRRRAAGKRFSPLVAYMGLVLLSAVLFLASTLPQTVKYYSAMNEIFDELSQLVELYNGLQTSGDLGLVSQMQTLSDELENKADYVTGRLVKYASAVFTIWAVLWAACIVTSAILLRKSIEVCIASLPGVPVSARASIYKSNNLSEPPTLDSASTNASSTILDYDSQSSTLGHSTPLYKTPSYPALPEDRPFGNFMARSRTTLHPRHFQVVLDAPAVSASEKTRQLRVLLRKDAFLSGLFLLVLLLSVGDALFLACGAFTFTPGPENLKPQTALLIYYTWGSYSFLLPAIPGSVNFLFASLRSSIAPRDYRPSSSAETLTTFSIPLVTTVGIGVQQPCVISEYGGKGSEMAPDEEKLPEVRAVRYT